MAGGRGGNLEEEHDGREPDVDDGGNSQAGFAVGHAGKLLSLKQVKRFGLAKLRPNARRHRLQARPR